MNTAQIALAAATTSVVAWAAKSVAIWSAGGLDRSPLESPLFLVGFAANVVATVALVLVLTRSRPVVVKVAAILAVAAGIAAFIAVVDGIVQRVQPVDASWVWAEMNLWFVAAVLLALTVWVVRRPAGRAV